MSVRKTVKLGEGYNKPEDAHNGHLKLCNKWAKND